MSNLVDLLDFLMTNSVDIVHTQNGRSLSADGLYDISGEYVIYQDNKLPELWRGSDLETAMMYLNGEENDIHP